MQVSQQATKAWIFRFTRAGVPRKMGLGPVSVKPDDKRITLADARQKAAAARSLLIDGIDPIAARDARRAQAALADAQAVTFKHCADEYLKDNEGSWKNEVHRKQWASTLKTYVHPVIGALPVAGVDTGLGGVDSKDSLFGANQIQSCFSGGSLGCDGPVGFERCDVGADGAADHRPA